MGFQGRSGGGLDPTTLMLIGVGLFLMLIHSTTGQEPVKVKPGETKTLHDLYDKVEAFCRFYPKKSEFVLGDPGEKNRTETFLKLHTADTTVPAKLDKVGYACCGSSPNFCVDGNNDVDYSTLSGDVPLTHRTWPEGPGGSGSGSTGIGFSEWKEKAILLPLLVSTFFLY